MSVELEHPLESFKRATVATVRAIAEDNEVEVAFGQGSPVLRGNRVRMPLPTVGCDDAEINSVRGIGDELALKLRFHDEAVHNRFAPRSGPAQEMFEWIEDARIASIGLRRFEGVAQNLEASLEAHCRQAEFDSVVDVSEAPLSVAVGLLVRQHLTGRELPPSAENLVQFWRDHVQENAGDDIAALKGCLHDQRRFATVCREIIADLGLGAELEDPLEELDNQDETEASDEDAEGDAEFDPDDVVIDDEGLTDESADGEAPLMEMDADSIQRNPAPRQTGEAPLVMPDDAGPASVWM